MSENPLALLLLSLLRFLFPGNSICCAASTALESGRSCRDNNNAQWQKRGVETGESRVLENWEARPETRSLVGDGEVRGRGAAFRLEFRFPRATNTQAAPARTPIIPAG